MKRRRRRSRFRFNAIPPNAVEESTFDLSQAPACETPGDMNLEFVPGPVETVLENSVANELDSAPAENVCETEDPGLDENTTGSGSGEVRLQSARMQTSADYKDQSVGTLIPNWRVLWSLLVTNGSRRFTKNQYQSVRVCAEAILRLSKQDQNEEPAHYGDKLSCFPHYSTREKVWRPLLLLNLGPRAMDHTVQVDVGKAGAPSCHCSADGTPQTSVRIVLPSEFARADIATLEVFSAIFSTSLAALQERNSEEEHPSTTKSACVDLMPLVLAREWFYGPPTHISVDYSASFGPYVNIGETGEIDLLTKNPLDERFVRSFCVDAQNSPQHALMGQIAHIWSVHHSKRKNSKGFEDKGLPRISARDKAIATIFNFVTYVSPSAGVYVQVPELPVESDDDLSDTERNTRKQCRKLSRIAAAMRARNSALKRKQIAIAPAWRDWRPPMLKPGDVVALIKPVFTTRQENTLLTAADRDSRLLLVHRFRVENEERSRHVVWIPGGRDLSAFDGDLHSADVLPSLCDPLTSTTSDLCLPIKCVMLASTDDGPRGPLKFQPVWSVGALSNREPYCVYRFLIYWDGFEVQGRKSASGDGVYLICLNFPTQARCTSNAVRIISLTPPGVKADAILGKIVDDIVEGMTVGFLDIDANGTKRRIFLDLVAFLGDTPALNASLDVLGHTAASFCHFCRCTRRSSTQVGSRFTVKSQNPSVTSLSRSFFSHTAVRDCRSKEDKCRQLGLKAHPSPSNSVLSKIRSRIVASADKILLTSEGVPVVPCVLDPYRACLVAPDHLLTAHVREFVNMVFKMLPTPDHRSTCEGFMLGLLADSSLPTQSRLLDADEKYLYSMSMTELYALALVAGKEFKMGCASEEARSNSSIPSAKCKSAIDIVSSAGSLISELWFKPDIKRDEFEAVQSHKEDNGSTYFNAIQKMTDKHIGAVQRICSMADDDYAALQDSNTPKSAEMS